ncbi:MAG TPA: cation:proton antiporter [Candidatus Thermoplasmatota archaeon]|nr:cation:proton antiporter [Candidatus Thermoplasmatota archaeon]
MAEASALFLDFGIILLVAGAVALLFYYLRQPVVLGYLVAGFFVGPYSPGPSFVEDADVMAFFSELGIVFLLFALGLEFNLRKLRKVGMAVVVAGVLQTAIMIGLGYLLGQAFGWTPLQSVYLGGVMSISSTVIIVKVFAELGYKDEDWAQSALGILIVEDVLAVLILTALGSAATTGNFAPELLGSLVWKLGIFLGAALLLGLLAGPRLVDRLAFVKVEEVTVLVASGVGMGMAVLAHALGFSAGLGAFIAGALMAESPRVARITHRVEPVRDIFAAVFFVAVGAAVDPASLVANWRPILVVTAAVILGKILGVSLATFLMGTSPGKSLRIGIALAQIGEFAFIIAALGVSLGVADPDLYAIAIAVCAITAFVSPFLIRASPRLVGALGRTLPSGVHAYALAYSTWVRRLGRTDRASPEWRRIRLNTLTAALNASAFIAVFALGATFGPRVREDVGLFAGAEWLVVSLALTPFAYMWYREVQHVILDLSRLAVPAWLRSGATTVPERLLRRTFGFVTLVATAFFCVTLAQVFVDNVVPVLLIAGVGILVGSYVLGSSLRRFHDEVERTIERMTADDAGAPVATSREEAMHMLQHAHAWGAGNREVRIPATSGAAGRSIGQLRLRELTGASVVSVQRDGQDTLTHPGRDLRFEAEDVVLLVGDDLSLTRAEEILLGRDLGVEGGATELVLRAAHSGQPLAALDLPRGVEVLVVRRGAESHPARPDLRLLEGDVLVVIGSDVEVARAQEALRGA